MTETTTVSERTVRTLNGVEHGVSWLALAILLCFTYARFFVAPYTGFNWQPNGRITRVYLSQDWNPGLEVGDQLVSIGPLLWADFDKDRSRLLFENVQIGQIVPIVIERNAQRLIVPWVFPGPTRTEVFERLNSEWILAYIFWCFGLVTLLVVRPRDRLQQLLMAFNFVTAFWLMFGSLSHWHTWYSNILYTTVIWLALPIYLHFHWRFPRPLVHLPRIAWWTLYGLGITLALTAFFQIIPASLTNVGLLVAVGGSAVLLVTHFVVHAGRRETGLVLLAAGAALVPPIVIGIVASLVTLPPLAGGSLLSLVFVPGAYLYAISRHRLGGLELRVNRLIAIYAFLVLLVTLIFILVPVLEVGLQLPSTSLVVSLVSALVVALVAIFGYGPFERFIERRILAIPLPPTQLLQAYATRIPRSLNMEILQELLCNQIVSSLLIRQSMLIRLINAQPEIVYQMGIDDSRLPMFNAVGTILGLSEKYLNPSEDHFPLPRWVRLVIPLYIGETCTGLWLLGRRDPEDYYSQNEIPVLRALADQTAVALSNIFQTEQLHVFHQANIGQHEAERASLARELHDDVLRRMAALNLALSATDFSPAVSDLYEAVVTEIRNVISNLRPAMLSYGLRAALEELANELMDRQNGNVTVRLDIPDSDARYGDLLEQHVYRIAQEACENVLSHARAHNIRLSGQLDAKLIDLTIDDDGVGFAIEDHFDLLTIVERKHYGLAGMFERATLINADLNIISNPGGGTRVRLVCNFPLQLTPF